MSDLATQTTGWPLALMDRELKPGTIYIGKYKVAAYYGEGTLGEAIYVAADIKRRRDVFLKVLPRSLSQDDEFGARFSQEAQISVNLNHPHVLRAFEAGDRDGCYYMVTDYAKGQFLSELLRRQGALPEDSALHMALSLSEALKYVWENHKILHRNIRPETIFITEDGRAMLSDFGLAKKVGPGGKNLTAAGVAIGDSQYMSKEQILGEWKLDSRVDIYCLGLIIHQAITNDPPFGHLTPSQITDAQLHEDLPLLSEINSDVSEGFSQVVDKMLRKDREYRYQTWDELIGDFETLINDENPPSLTTPELRREWQERKIAPERGVAEISKTITADKHLSPLIPALIAAFVMFVGIALIIVRILRPSVTPPPVDPYEPPPEPPPRIAAPATGGEAGGEQTPAPTPEPPPGKPPADIPAKLADAIIPPLVEPLVEGRFAAALGVFRENRGGKTGDALTAVEGHLENLVGINAFIAETFRPEIGHEITIATIKGDRSVTPREIRDGALWYMDNSGPLPIRAQIPVADLAFTEKRQRVAGFADQVAANLYLGVELLRSHRGGQAKRYLDNSGVFSKYLIQWIGKQPPPPPI